MKAIVIRFPGNPRPAVRHGKAAVVVILPVIRIEGVGPTPHGVKRRRRRRKEYRG